MSILSKLLLILLIPLYFACSCSNALFQIGHFFSHLNLSLNFNFHHHHHHHLEEKDHHHKEWPNHDHAFSFLLTMDRDHQEEEIPADLKEIKLDIHQIGEMPILTLPEEVLTVNIAASYSPKVMPANIYTISPPPEFGTSQIISPD